MIISKFIWGLFFLPIFNLSIAQDFPNQYRYFETKLLNTAIPDIKNFLPEYDFIVIGAGTAGCVIANRLTETSSDNVLVLEAGDQETLISDVPLTAALLSVTRYNWGYKSEPEKNACQGLEGGVCSIPKGRGIGGSSLLNFMVISRGHRKDYDRWLADGNSGWGYNDVLPYFKKFENIEIPSLRNSVYHGTNGPINVQYPPYSFKISNPFLEAGKILGYNLTDLNGENMIGFSRIHANLRNGRRCSTSKAYISPILKRRNLFISMNSRVTKIVIDSITKKAEGVIFLKNKKRYYVRIKKEIIVSAGAIASPQLLMLSGIGPTEHLKELEINVMKDLKVGYNMLDHLILPGLTFLVNQSITLIEANLIRPKYIYQYILNRKGPYTSPGGTEAYAFIRTNNSKTDRDYPDIEIVLGASGFNNDMSGTVRKLIGITDEFYQKLYSGIIGKPSFAIVPALMNQKSIGRLSLRSKNPFDYPKIRMNYLQHEEETSTILDAIKFILELVETEPFKKINTRLLRTPFPGCENYEFLSDDYWKCCLRQYATSLQHHSGTCKMGPESDPNAVVGSDLKVHGIDRLRVIDASIIPTLPAGHTNAIVLMIAEKGSDLIKKYWNL